MCSTQRTDPASTSTILLVEDEPAVRGVVKRVLQRHGFNVLEAKSAAEAIQLWREHSSTIQLLFTDLSMPEGADGTALAQQLRAEQQHLRVLYTTGHSRESMAAKGAVSESDEFLFKPFRPAELIEAVRRVLA